MARRHKRKPEQGRARLVNRVKSEDRCYVLSLSLPRKVIDWLDDQALYGNIPVSRFAAKAFLALMDAQEKEGEQEQEGEKKGAEAE